MQTQTIQISKLPEGWEVKKLSEIAEIIMGQSPSSKTYNSEIKGLPFFQGKAEFGDIYPTPKKWCTEPKKIAQKNDVLMSVRAPVGPVNLANSECCIGRGLCAIRANYRMLNYKYLYNFLKLQEDILSQKGQGSTFTAISRKDVFEIEVPIPFPNNQKKSLEIQQKIVSKLDAFFEHYNRLKEEKRKAKENYEKILQSAIASLIPAKKLPEGWEEKELGKLVSIRKDKIDPNKEKLFNYVGLEHIQSKKAKIIEYVKNPELKSIKNKFRKGDLLYGKLRPNLNKVWIAEFDGVCSTDILPLITNEEILPEYLLYVLLSDRFVNFASSESAGIQLPRVSFKTISKYYIKYPAKEHQIEIIKKIENIQKALNVFSKEQNLIDNQLSQLPKAVLSRAFRGEMM